MKTIHYVCTALFASLALSCNNSRMDESAHKWFVVETTSFDWDGDGKTDEFILEKPQGWTDGGDYLRIKILMDGKPEFVLSNDDGWQTIEGSLPVALIEKNEIKSKHLYFVPISKKEKALLLFGWGYASEAQRLDVLVIEDNYPKAVFSDNLQLMQIDDVNNDSLKEFIGLPWLIQSYGARNQFSDYVPSLVYSFVNLFKTGSWKMYLDLDLSKKYNVLHKSGWVDLNDTVHYVNVTVVGKEKPLLMKYKEAKLKFGSQ